MARDRALWPSYFAVRFCVVVAAAWGIWAYRKRATFTGLMLFWALFIVHVAHGQLDSPGYHIGYMVGVVAFSFLFEITLRQIICFYGLGMAVFFPVLFFSKAKYGLLEIPSFHMDVLFSALVANLLGIASYHFITRKKIETEELYRRYADVGKYSSIIIHDLKNLITGPGVLAELIQHRVAESNDQTLSKLSEPMVRDLRNLRTYVDDVLRFSAESAEQEEDIQLSELVAAVRTLLGSKLANIELTCTIDAKLRVKRGYLFRSIFNAALNAADAVAKHSGTEGWIRVDIQGATISVYDNGGGIPEDVLKKIQKRRSAGLTTKTQGTGMGIMIIQDYMESLGGSAEFQNGPAGAIVELKLPSTALLTVPTH